MKKISAALRGVALKIIHISNDIQLLSSKPNTDFAEIYLPSLQPGSSIIPNKINPMIPKLATMVSFQIVSNDAAITLTMQNNQLKLNIMIPTITYNVMQNATILANMLRQFNDRYVTKITTNKKRCDFYAQNTISLATTLNPYINYAKTTEIVKKSVATNESIIKIARAKKLLNKNEIHAILNPINMTEPQYPHESTKERDQRVKT